MIDQARTLTRTRRSPTVRRDRYRARDSVIGYTLCERNQASLLLRRPRSSENRETTRIDKVIRWQFDRIDERHAAYTRLGKSAHVVRSGYAGFRNGARFYHGYSGTSKLRQMFDR